MPDEKLPPIRTAQQWGSSSGYSDAEWLRWSEAFTQEMSVMREALEQTNRGFGIGNRWAPTSIEISHGGLTDQLSERDAATAAYPLIAPSSSDTAAQRWMADWGQRTAPVRVPVADPPMVTSPEGRGIRLRGKPDA